MGLNTQRATQHQQGAGRCAGRRPLEESGPALRSTGARGHCLCVPGLQGLREAWKVGLRPLPGTARPLSHGWVACGCSLVPGQPLAGPGAVGEEKGQFGLSLQPRGKVPKSLQLPSPLNQGPRNHLKRAPTPHPPPLHRGHTVVHPVFVCMRWARERNTVPQAQDTDLGLMPCPGCHRTLGTEFLDLGSLLLPWSFSPHPSHTPQGSGSGAGSTGGLPRGSLPKAKLPLPPDAS